MKYQHAFGDLAFGVHFPSQLLNGFFPIVHAAASTGVHQRGVLTLKYFHGFSKTILDRPIFHDISTCHATDFINLGGEDGASDNA